MTIPSLENKYHYPWLFNDHCILQIRAAIYMYFLMDLLHSFTIDALRVFAVSNSACLKHTSSHNTQTNKHPNMQTNRQNLPVSLGYLDVAEEGTGDLS